MDATEVDKHVDALVEADVLIEDETTGELATTDEFEADRHVYYDTYLSMEDEEFHQSVAETFDLESADEAAEYVEEYDVSREEFSTYLTLYAQLEEYAREDIAEMAAIATEVGPQSPVPDSLAVLDDEGYQEFLVDNDRAIVTVWKRGCAPCDAMKDELGEVLGAFPEDASVAGLDGEQCPGFCKEFEVNAAPAIALFADGEVLDVKTGRMKPENIAEWCEEQYDGD